MGLRMGDSSRIKVVERRVKGAGRGEERREE